MSLNTWYHRDLRNEYRKKIRLAGDEFRKSLNQCWEITNFQGRREAIHENFYDIQDLDESWSQDSRCTDILSQTLIWRLVNAIEKVLPWFDFNAKALDEKRNAFRLLELELYCRINSYDPKKLRIRTSFINERIEGMIEKLCTNPSDPTSRVEYFQV